MGDFGVEVVEPVTGIELGVAHRIGGGLIAAHVVDGHDGWNEEQLGIGAARREAEGGALLDDRPLEIELGRDETHRKVAVQLTVIAVVLRNVKHRREAAAEAGGEGTLVEGYVLDGIGVEGGEESAHVADIVERHTVEEKQVLVGAAATDIHATVALRTALHTGHELERLDEVSLTEHDGHRLDFLHRNDGGAHLRRAGVPYPLGGNDNLVEHHRGLELDVELAVAVELETESLGLVADKGNLEADGVAAEGERVAAVEIGNSALATAGIDDSGTDEGFAVGGVNDGAADGEILRHGPQGRQQKQKQRYGGAFHNRSDRSSWTVFPNRGCR